MNNYNQKFKLDDFVYCLKLDPNKSKIFKIKGYLPSGKIHLESIYDGSRYDAPENDLELITDDEVFLQASIQDSIRLNDLYGVDE